MPPESGCLQIPDRCFFSILPLQSVQIVAAFLSLYIFDFAFFLTYGAYF